MSDELLTNDEAKELRVIGRRKEFDEFIQKVIKMDKRMTAEQAVFISTSLNLDFKQCDFYLTVLEKLTNPYDLIPLIKILKVFRDSYEIERIEDRLFLLSKMKLIPPMPEPEPEESSSRMATVKESLPEYFLIIGSICVSILFLIFVIMFLF